MKGVPLRVEIGPKDIESNQCVTVTRHDRKKTFVSLDNLEEAVKQELKNVHDGLYAKALENREKRTYSCASIDESNPLLSKRRRLCQGNVVRRRGVRGQGQGAYRSRFTLYSV